jgi:Holliday junction DNA helicase RuvB
MNYAYLDMSNLDWRYRSPTNDKDHQMPTTSSNSRTTIHTAALPSLDDVIGQRAVVERLKVAVAAAKADDRAIDHFLLYGPGGTGKSTLVQIVANAMATVFKETLASALNEGGMASYLLDASDKHILFIDEVHELEQTNMTVMYRALAERKLFLPGSRKSRSLPLAAFSCFAATTDPHTLPPSFRERFVELHLDFYTPLELTEIVKQRSGTLGWQADESVYAEIGRLGRGIPRLALRLLTASREVCRSRNKMNVTIEHFQKACQLEDRDGRLGLDRNERSILRFLDQADGPVRLNVLASRLGICSKTATMYETFLVRSGLILRTEQGRALTPDGIEYVRSTPISQVTV